MENAILEVVNGSGSGWIEPAEVGGGDEPLGFEREVGEEVRAAGGVEFAENVVDEENGDAGGASDHEAGLGELEGDGEGALLALGGEFDGVEAVDFEGEVVAVGADDGLAEAGLAVARGWEGCGE